LQSNAADNLGTLADTLPTQANGTTEPNRGGAPLGNRNRTRHGLRGIGWPDGADSDKRNVNKLRRALADAVLAAGGNLDIPTCSLIEQIGDWERHRRLAARWLRTEKGLTIDQRLLLSREIARASRERHSCLKLLRLERPVIDALDAKYAPCLPDATDDVGGDKPAGEPQAEQGAA
jgi:hypothetical protein